MDPQPNRVTPLQREDSRTDAALRRDLASVEDHAAAVRLERLAADAEIILTLRLQNFDPTTPDWRMFQAVLIEYGYGVCLAWAKAGVIRQMAARHAHGRGVLGLHKVPELVRFDDQDAHDFVSDLIVTSVEAFRTKSLMNPRKTWREDGGASITTFFIGRVLMEFPGEYRRFTRSRQNLVTLDDPEQHDRHPADDDPEGVALGRVELDETFGAGTPLRMMFDLWGEGWGYDAIAEVLTVSFNKEFTARQVATTIYRKRQELRGTRT